MALAVALAFVSFLGESPALDADAPPPAPPVELWVLDPQRLSTAEQTLAATLQGVLKKSTQRSGCEPGMSAVVLEELKAEGATLHEAASPWEIVRGFATGSRGRSCTNRAARA